MNEPYTRRCQAQVRAVGVVRCRESLNQGAHRCILSVEHTQPDDPQGPDHRCPCGAVFSPADHVEQPMPMPNNRRSIQSLVRADLENRERVGIERYGTPLQAHNGRDVLRDAYEEALDLACYLRQAIEERNSESPQPTGFITTTSAGRQQPYVQRMNLAIVVGMVVNASYALLAGVLMTTGGRVTGAEGVIIAIGAVVAMPAMAILYGRAGAP